MNHGAEQANIGIRHQAITYRLDRIIELLTALAVSPAPDPGAGLREALLGLRGVIGENCWCWQVQADRTQHEDTCLAAQAALVLERTP